MLSGVLRCAAGASPRGMSRHLLRLLAVSLLALTAAACKYTGEPLGPLAAARSATIAIDSIDGPPQALTKKFATNLSEEAEVRKLAIVGRDDPAQYRVRAYLSMHAERGKSSVTWVWDVYGADKRRALRITGEEANPNTSREEWAAVDERVLRQIARNGMDRLLIFLNSSETTDLTAVPETAALRMNIAGMPSQ
jgi:hypothetical protein